MCAGLNGQGRHPARSPHPRFLAPPGQTRGTHQPMGETTVALKDRATTIDTRSKFEKWLDSLNPSNRAVVEGWLRDESIANAKITEWIRADDPEDDFTGYACHSDTIAKWRKANGVNR